MLPLVNDAEDVHRAKRQMTKAGIDPEKRKWGVMIETPASALCADELAATGIDFASFGTNDLTQYTLAVDRNNKHVADRFDELHPGVLRLIGDVIETCREHDVDTSICGQAGSKPDMVQFLVNEGEFDLGEHRRRPRRPTRSQTGRTEAVTRVGSLTVGQYPVFDAVLPLPAELENGSNWLFDRLNAE